MNVMRALSHVPTALIFAVSAWAPIDPFRPKPFEPAAYECASAERHPLGLRACTKDDSFEMAFRWNERPYATGYRLMGHIELCNGDTMKIDEHLGRRDRWFHVLHVDDARDVSSYDVTLQAIGDYQELGWDELVSPQYLSNPCLVM